MQQSVRLHVPLTAGVRAKFQAVLGVRQMHRMAFGKSDLFFICGLRCVWLPSNKTTPSSMAGVQCHAVYALREQGSN